MVHYQDNIDPFRKIDRNINIQIDRLFVDIYIGTYVEISYGQIYSLIDRQIDGQLHRQTDRQIDICIAGQMDRMIGC